MNSPCSCLSYTVTGTAVSMCPWAGRCLWQETMWDSCYSSDWMDKRCVSMNFILKVLRDESCVWDKSEQITRTRLTGFLFVRHHRFSATSCTKPKWPMQSSTPDVTGCWRRPQLTTRWSFGTWGTSKTRRVSCTTCLMRWLSTQVTVALSSVFLPFPTGNIFWLLTNNMTSMQYIYII